MMTRDVLDPDMTLDEIMRRWPGTIRVVIRHRMLCVGCPIGIFHTVADAAAAHAIDEALLSAALIEAIGGDPDANAPSAFLTEEDAGPLRGAGAGEGSICGGSPTAA